MTKCFLVAAATDTYLIIGALFRDVDDIYEKAATFAHVVWRQVPIKRIWDSTDVIKTDAVQFVTTTDELVVSCGYTHSVFAPVRQYVGNPRQEDTGLIDT
jgi:hypothetical protein